MNNTEYWQEVGNTTDNIFSEAQDYCKENGLDPTDTDELQDYINDSLLHETIDGHEYIIYTANHLPILQISSNSDYMADNIGGLESSLNRGLDTLHCSLAFWAFYADVSDKLNDLIDCM